MQNVVKKIKDDQKELAKAIRTKKSFRKKFPHGLVPGLFEMKRTFRHKHIAYCMMSGTPYEKIERPSKYNKPNMELVRAIIKEWREKEAA